MHRKISLLIVIATTMLGVFLLNPGAANLAHAQDQAVPEDSACRTCHEDQYTLHDSGKWYCLNETRVSCTECHGGSPGSATKETAHEGLAASPLANDAAVCQDCHPEDYPSKVQIFASVAGIRPTPRPYVPYTPSTSVSTLVEDAGRLNLPRDYLPGAWQALGLLVLGILFMVLFLFSSSGRKTAREYSSK